MRIGDYRVENFRVIGKGKLSYYEDRHDLVITFEWDGDNGYFISPETGEVITDVMAVVWNFPDVE
jgi:hypothetical protein